MTFCKFPVTSQQVGPGVASRGGLRGGAGEAAQVGLYLGSGCAPPWWPAGDTGGVAGAYLPSAQTVTTPGCDRKVVLSSPGTAPARPGWALDPAQHVQGPEAPRPAPGRAGEQGAGALLQGWAAAARLRAARGRCGATSRAHAVWTANGRPS